MKQDVFTRFVDGAGFVFTKIKGVWHTRAITDQGLFFSALWKKGRELTGSQLQQEMLSQVADGTAYEMVIGEAVGKVVKKWTPKVNGWITLLRLDEQNYELQILSRDRDHPKQIDYLAIKLTYHPNPSDLKQLIDDAAVQLHVQRQINLGKTTHLSEK